MPGRVISADVEVEAEIAWLGDAHPDTVARVLASDTGTGEGKSVWTWIRLANGDLFLGVAPQGAMYESLEGEPGAGWGT